MEMKNKVIVILGDKHASTWISLVVNYSPIHYILPTHDIQCPHHNQKIITNANIPSFSTYIAINKFWATYEHVGHKPKRLYIQNMKFVNGTWVKINLPFDVNWTICWSQTQCISTIIQRHIITLQRNYGIVLLFPCLVFNPKGLQIKNIKWKTDETEKACNPNF
jgi:hypothetical protein